MEYWWEYVEEEPNYIEEWDIEGEVNTNTDID